VILGIFYLLLLGGFAGLYTAYALLVGRAKDEIG
jgi:hypothetical protein